MRDAIRAGAIGFTTSRSPAHETPNGQPVASRLATWDEVRRLVGVMGELNAGPLRDRRRGRRPRAGRSRAARLPRPAARSRRRDRAPGHVRRLQPPRRARRLAQVSRSARRDRRRRRAHVRPGAQPLAERAALVQDADAVRSTSRCGRSCARCRSPSSGGGCTTPSCAAGSSRCRASATGGVPSGPRPKPADYDWLLVFDTVEGPHRTVAEVARERGQHPAETMIDLALAKDLDLFFLQPVANEDQDYALELMRHPAGRASRSPTRAPTSPSSWTRRCRRICSSTGCAASRPSPSSRPCGC